MKKIFGKIPIYKGDWSEGVTVKEKFRFTYRGSEFQALRDGLTTAPLNDNDEPNDGWIYISNGTDAYRAAEKIAKNESDIANLKSADIVHDSRILELEKSQFPLVITLDLSNTLLEYTGEEQTVSVSYTVKHKGVLKLPKTLSLTQDEVVITDDPAKEDAAPITVNKLGDTVVKLSATAHSYYDYHSDKTDDIISASVQKSIQMVLPIYAGFGTSADGVKTDENKLSVRTSAAGTYNKTCQADGQNFYILVPRTFAALTSFTMGGAPFVMETSDITLGDYEYKQYKSGAVYNTGATVNIKAS